MAHPAGHRLARAAFIAAVSALTLFALSAWGLRGAAVLIALFGLSWFGFFLWRSNTQRRIRARLAQIPADRRAAVLAGLSEQDRAEILDAITSKTRP